MTRKKDDWYKVTKEQNEHHERVTMTETAINLNSLREFNEPKNIVSQVHFYVVEEHHRRP